MAIFFDTYIDISPASPVVWTETDLSPYLPNADCIAIVFTTSAGAYTVGMRPTGFADTSLYTNYGRKTYFVGVDSNIHADFYQTSSLKIYLLGYLEDSLYFEEADRFTITGYTTGSYGNIDLSAHIPTTASYALLQVQKNSGQGIYFRPPGSADDYYQATDYHTDGFFLAPALNGIINAKIETTLSEIKLTGYIAGTEATWDETATDISLSSTGSYTPIDVKGSEPYSIEKYAAAIIDVISPLNNMTAGLRRAGDTDDYTIIARGYTGEIIPPNQWGFVEGKIGNVVVDFYLRGYIKGTVASSVNHSDLLDKLDPINGTAGFWEDLKDVWGNALDTLQKRIDQGSRELFAHLCDETIEQWEARYGAVPNAGDTLGTRRDRVLSKIRARGGLSRQYFIDIAAAAGYVITITEYVAFRADISKAGDPLYSEEEAWHWLVSITTPTSTFQADINAAGDRVSFPSDTALADIFDLFEILKPAHTVIDYDFS